MVDIINGDWLMSRKESCGESRKGRVFCFVLLLWFQTGSFYVCRPETCCVDQAGGTQRSAFRCFSSAGIKGMGGHILLFVLEI